MVILEFRRSATPNSGLTCRLFPKQRDLHFPAQNARVGKRKQMVLHQPLLWDPLGDTWFSQSLLTPVAFRPGEQLPFPEKGHPGASNPPGRLGRWDPPARPPLVSALQLSPVQRQPRSHRFPHLTQFLGSSISAAHPE